MNDAVVAVRKRRVYGGHKELEDVAVLDRAHTQQVRACAAVHLPDDRCELRDLLVAPLRRPTSKIFADRCWSFSVWRGEFSSSKRVFEVPPGDVVDRRHCDDSSGS
jgi:hypothetical protein